MTPMIKQYCFIFDLDGTLLDDVHIFSELFTKGVPAYFNKQISPEKEKYLTDRANDLIAGKSSKFFIVENNLVAR